ncbi:hypothetical protein GB937_007613 [Aspergillus fischeri]|nr:hypothetical protein GB937_007613 [Aspergillus fischeri]
MSALVEFGYVWIVPVLFVACTLCLSGNLPRCQVRQSSWILVLSGIVCGSPATPRHPSFITSRTPNHLHQELHEMTFPNVKTDLGV